MIIQLKHMVATEKITKSLWVTELELNKTVECICCQPYQCHSQPLSDFLARLSLNTVHK